MDDMNGMMNHLNPLEPGDEWKRGSRVALFSGTLSSYESALRTGMSDQEAKAAAERFDRVTKKLRIELEELVFQHYRSAKRDEMSETRIEGMREQVNNLHREIIGTDFVFDFVFDFVAQ